MTGCLRLISMNIRMLRMIERRRNSPDMIRLAIMLLTLGCLGSMIVMMPDAVAALPFRDRMWCYGLGIIFFAMGWFSFPERS
jgi:hypothetical protein